MLVLLTKSEEIHIPLQAEGQVCARGEGRGAPRGATARRSSAGTAWLLGALVHLGPSFFLAPSFDQMLHGVAGTPYDV